MNKSHKASIRDSGSNPIAPKLQEYIEDPCDRAIAKANRAIQIIEQLRTRFKPEEIDDMMLQDDECFVFLRSGKRYKAYLTSDSGLCLKKW